MLIWTIIGATAIYYVVIICLAIKAEYPDNDQNSNQKGG